MFGSKELYYLSVGFGNSLQSHPENNDKLPCLLLALAFINILWKKGAVGYLQLNQDFIIFLKVTVISQFCDLTLMGVSPISYDVDLMFYFVYWA